MLCCIIEAVKLKKRSSGTWVSQRTDEAAVMHRMTKLPVKSVVVEAKTVDLFKSSTYSLKLKKTVFMKSLLLDDSMFVKENISCATIVLEDNRQTTSLTVAYNTRCYL